MKVLELNKNAPNSTTIDPITQPDNSLTLNKTGLFAEGALTLFAPIHKLALPTCQFLIATTSLLIDMIKKIACRIFKTPGTSPPPAVDPDAKQLPGTSPPPAVDPDAKQLVRMTLHY